MTDGRASIAPSLLAGEGRGGGLSVARHIVRRGGEAQIAVPSHFARHSQGFGAWTVVGEETPAVHTGFAICTLAADGSIAPHVHSYEESFYVIEGEAEVTTSEGSFHLRPGDYGLIPVGVPHSWRGHSGQARWAEMTAPQPRSRFAYDTFFMDSLPREPGPPAHASRAERAMRAFEAFSEGEAVDVRDPRTRSFGHIEPGNMEVNRQTQDQLAVSASMRTALLVYSGITVKMMIDSDLGAELSTMFMVQYQPNGVAGQHDHPLEETYMILEGTVDAVFDGERYRLEAGDIAFAGVGCVHGFSNPANTPVRWLETQAPQPPGRHSYRFARDWDYLKTQLPDSQT
jgi:quercetin dioxygenase-like cupin family protein